MIIAPPVWLVSVIQWVQTTTQFPEFVNANGWLWAAAETVHFMGLCLLLGTIGAFDLRLLGVAKNLPIGPIERLIPWGVSGFVICALTGAFFVFGNHWTANAYLANPAFQWKMLLIMLAGINVLAFNKLKLPGRVAVLGAGSRVPLSAKVIAATSLVLWIAVIVLGRFLPILGDAF